VVVLLAAASPVRPAAGETPVQTFVTGSGRSMGLYIRAGSADFATLRHDLALAPGLVVRRDVDGRPQCNFNSQDGVEGTAVFLPEGCGDEAACRGLRLEFSYGYSPLSPYVPLAECAVIERPELGPPSMGCSFRVDCTERGMDRGHESSARRSRHACGESASSYSRR
jgi:hypothetical protein